MSDKKITKEDIRIVAEEVFKDNPITSPERKFTGARGCATYGLVDFNSSMWHCGDKNCEGCNMVCEATNKAIKEMLQQYKNQGYKYTDDNLKL